MSDFSHTRKWWPEACVDEWMPAGRDRPEDWLAPDANGVTEVRDTDVGDNAIITTIRPGEIAAFVWHESRGSVDILLMPDGTWAPFGAHDCSTADLFEGDRPLPSKQPMADIAGANWFAWDEDYESCADSMDEFARCFADLDPPDTEGRRITVDLGRWSEPERFRVSADGKSLERIDP